MAYFCKDRTRLQKMKMLLLNKCRAANVDVNVTHGKEKKIVRQSFFNC